MQRHHPARQPRRVILTFTLRTATWLRCCYAAGHRVGRPAKGRAVETKEIRIGSYRTFTAQLSSSISGRDVNRWPDHLCRRWWSNSRFVLSTTDWEMRRSSSVSAADCRTWSRMTLRSGFFRRGFMIKRSPKNGVGSMGSIPQIRSHQVHCSLAVVGKARPKRALAFSISPKSVTISHASETHRGACIE